MKVFTDQKWMKRIAIILVIITLFTFMVPKTSHAFGGRLLGPIFELVVGLGDLVMMRNA